MKKIIFTLTFIVSNFALAANDITDNICDYLAHNDYIYREYPYQNSKSEKEIKEMRELHTELKKNMICGNLKRKVTFDYYSDVYLNNPVATLYFGSKADDEEKKLMETLLEVRERTLGVKKTTLFLGEVVAGKLNSIVKLIRTVLYGGKVSNLNYSGYPPVLNETCGDLIINDKIYHNLTIKDSIKQMHISFIAFQNAAGNSFIPSKKMMIKNMDYILSGAINPGPWLDERFTYTDFAGLDRIINCVQNKVIFGNRLPHSKKVF